MKAGKSFYTWEYLSEKAKVETSEQQSGNAFEVNKPLRKNIMAAKNTVIYNAHTYHTKVPPEGIVPYIKHFTQPGDVILDPFCGSGMTGVAGALIQSESVDEARKFILNDLGPAAVHIAFNHNSYCEPSLIEREFQNILDKCSAEVDALYQTWEVQDDSGKANELVGVIDLQKLKSAKVIKNFDGGETREIKLSGQVVRLVPARITSTIWSEAYSCSATLKGKKICGTTLTIWDHAFDKEKGVTKKKIECPKCGHEYTRSEFGRDIKTIPVFVETEFYDQTSGRRVRRKRAIFAFEREFALQISRSSIKDWYPKDNISSSREMMTMGPAKLGIKSVADFYTNRNLQVCSIIWREIGKVKDIRVQKVLAFAATNTFWHATRMRRFNARGGSRPLTGTLYVPQISIECNVLDVLKNKIRMLTKYYSFVNKGAKNRDIQFLLGSATKLKVPANSIDYIYTDPPFGGNIYYSDCSIIWEAWLGSFTDEQFEMHFNRSRKPSEGGKTIDDYRQLMFESYREMFRVLKPGKWASIVFNNSDDRVLEAFRETAERAGFEIGEVAFFDKKQKSFKGYLGRDGKQKVTNCDIILNIRKPRGAEKAITIRPRHAISDTWIKEQVAEYLTSLPSLMKKRSSVYTNEHRTLPFIHNHLMKVIFKENQSFQGLSLDRIEVVLKRFFAKNESQWYTKVQYRTLDTQLSFDVA